MDKSVYTGRASELTGSFLIKFDLWQCCKDGNRVPPAGALEELEGIAIEHICAMVLENYTEGELFQKMNGNTYRGYWRYSKQ